MKRGVAHFVDISNVSRDCLKIFRAGTILLLLFSAFVSYGQESFDHADTLGISRRIDSLSSKELNKMDSATNQINSKIDSLQAKGLPTASYQKKLDSINLRLQNHLSLKAVSGKINGEASSLKSKLDVPSDSIQKEVKQKALALQKKIKKRTSSLDSLTGKIKDPTGHVNLPGANKLYPNLPETDLPGQALPNVNLPNSSVNVPEVNLPKEKTELNKLNKDLKFPKTQDLQVGNELKQVEALPKKELAATGITKEVNELKTEAKELKDLGKQAGDYKDDLKKIKEGDSAKMASLGKDAEKIAMERPELKDVKKGEILLKTQKNALQQYQDMLKDINKEKGLKEAEKLSAKEMTNHFAGQEVKLQAGMMQLEKLKKKYHAIPDSRYLPKRVPNEMKGKPFKERLVPGVSYQIYQRVKTGLDVSPFLMYRLTGRLRVGVGGSERLIIDHEHPYVSNAKIQSFRVMADFRALSAYYFHAEEEWTHYNPETQNLFRSPRDPFVKDWNMRLNVGIIKIYKISRRLDGQAQILYNGLDWSNFPQNKNTSMRFGVEYKLGLKKAKSK